MSEIRRTRLLGELTESQIIEYYENLLSYVRGRLNSISVSVYLLQTAGPEYQFVAPKYFQKINDEIESIRKLINE